MTLTIGRLAFAQGDAPSTWDVDSDGSVSVAGDLRAASVDELVAKRAALIGHANNPDEVVIPVTWSIAEDLSGFFRPTSIDVGTIPAGYAAMRLPWTATLAPVESARRPQVVSAMDQRLRTNANSISTSYPIHAVPAAVESWSWMPVATAQQETRQTAPGPAGGDVLYRRAASGVGQTTARWVCAPEHWYAGACSVMRRVKHVDVPVVGRQSLVNAWRAQNGLVQVWLRTNGRLAMRWWMPDGQWTPTTEFNLGQGGGFSFGGWKGAEITSLSPHQVTLRAQGVRSQGRTTLWITLYRGSRTVSVTIDTDTVPGHAVTPAVATPVTDATSHAWQTTAVAGSGGMHWLISAADDFGVNTTTGVVTPANSLQAQWSFGISAYFDGAAGDSGSRDATMRDWYATRSESVVVG